MVASDPLLKLGLDNLTHSYNQQPPPTDKTDFCLLYWNVSARAQLNEKLWPALKDRLDKMIAAHQPDVLCLSEILQWPNSSSPITDELKNIGYEVHYIRFYVLPAGLHEFGTIIASRSSGMQVEEHRLSPFKLSRYLGLAKVPAQHGNGLKIGVAHPIPIGARSLFEHSRQIQTLRQYLLNVKPNEKLILCGDLNELAWMTAHWQKKLPLIRKTGNLLQPTWTWGGWRFTPFRANLDSVLWLKQSPVELKEFSLLDRYPSDHAPLLAHFLIS